MIKGGKSHERYDVKRNPVPPCTLKIRISEAVRIEDPEGSDTKRPRRETTGTRLLRYHFIFQLIVEAGLSDEFWAWYEPEGCWMK